MSDRRCVALSLSLLAAGFLAQGESLRADEIEILELSPPPPASIDGIPEPAPDTPIVTTLSNSVTVVVRYRLDAGSAGVNVFPADTPSGPAGAGFRLVPPPPGTVPPCGTISGPSAGTCASTFARICSGPTPARLHTEQVGASLGLGVVVATDYTPARYTFSCPGRPPRREPSNCMVIGTADEPGESELPVPDFLPICRCLRDEGARELRCGLLHPDFFLLRRTPIPLIAGRPFTEVWEFLALTQLDAPVTVEITGAGQLDPVLHSFGAAGRQPGKIERFEVKADVPKGALSLRDRADFKYEMKDAGIDLERAWSVDRTVEVTVEKPR